MTSTPPCKFPNEETTLGILFLTDLSKGRFVLDPDILLEAICKIDDVIVRKLVKRFCEQQGNLLLPGAQP